MWSECRVAWLVLALRQRKRGVVQTSGSQSCAQLREPAQQPRRENGGPLIRPLEIEHKPICLLRMQDRSQRSHGSRARYGVIQKRIHRFHSREVFRR